VRDCGGQVAHTVKSSKGRKKDQDGGFEASKIEVQNKRIKDEGGIGKDKDSRPKVKGQR